MQCASCQFENMPGSEYCGRCGTTLALAEAEIDVHPPRAGRFTRRLRRWFPARGFFLRMHSERAFPTFARWMPRSIRMPLLDVLRLALPGCWQWAHGRRVVGRIYFIAYSIAALLGVTHYGTVTGSVLLGVAFSLHTSCIIEATNAKGSPGGALTRIGRGMFIALALTAIVYFPLGLIAMHFAEPFTILQDAGPLSAGEVLLMHHVGNPVDGDIVVYDIPIAQTRIAENHYQYARVGGRQIDRILAGPYSHVRITAGHLWINGAASPRSTLAGKLPDALEITVPPGSYLILPSTTQYARYFSNDRTVTIIAREQIVGTVWLRNQPWSHFGRLP